MELHNISEKREETETVALIYAAVLRQMKKLPPGDQDRVHEALKLLGEPSFRDRHSKHLAGHRGWRRMRFANNLRVIWRIDGDIISVGAALPRDEVYKNMDHMDGPSLEFAEPEDEGQIEESPAYCWNADTDFRQFIWGAYRLFPVRTLEQTRIFRQLEDAVCMHDEQVPVFRLQSAPGTGKSVCAALFACDMRNEYNSYTAVIVPAGVAEELGPYPEISRQLRARDSWTRFCLCPLISWLEVVSPETAAQTAGIELELKALKLAARRSRMRPTDIETLTYRDVALYQAFVINTGHLKDAAFADQSERIDQLSKIGLQQWKESLAGALCRNDAAIAVSQNPPPPPVGVELALLVVDEVQDYLLAEVQMLMTIRESWEQAGTPTVLILMGDLNQRVQPTGFYWDDISTWRGVPLPKLLPSLRLNFRNSQRILEFANHFLDLGRQQASDRRSRSLPAAPQPHDAFESGDYPGLLVVRDEREVAEFVEVLAMQAHPEAKERYLIRKLARQPKVLWPGSTARRDDVLIYDTYGAKGREFDACTVLLPFTGVGRFTLEESFQWYTLMTRAQLRLLVVARQEDLARVGEALFAKCKVLESAQDAALWIGDSSSEVDLAGMAEEIKASTLAAVKGCTPFFDTYQALQEAHVSWSEWENEALSVLTTRPPSALSDEMKETGQSIETVSLRTLYLRAMNCSWEAVDCATTIKRSNPEEYSRLITAIAEDLECGRATTPLASCSWSLYHGGLRVDIERKIAERHQPIALVLEASRIRMMLEAAPAATSLLGRIGGHEPLVFAAARAVIKSLGTQRGS